MTTSDFNWNDYYQNVSGREPREILFEALNRFGDDAPHRAIDLGCGDGTETRALLAKGWQVLAIDREPAAFDYLKAKTPPEVQARLQTQIAPFESVVLSPAELVYAGYSIPFCAPHAFDELWQKITDALTVGGRFAGQLFGVNDTWADKPTMTFFTEAEARALFEGFEIEYFREEDEEGRSTMGAKHWHVFHVVARKK